MRNPWPACAFCTALLAVSSWDGPLVPFPSLGLWPLPSPSLSALPDMGRAQALPHNRRARDWDPLSNVSACCSAPKWGEGPEGASCHSGLKSCALPTPTLEQQPAKGQRGWACAKTHQRIVGNTLSLLRTSKIANTQAIIHTKRMDCPPLHISSRADKRQFHTCPGARKNDSWDLPGRKQKRRAQAGPKGFMAEISLSLSPPSCQGEGM